MRPSLIQLSAILALSFPIYADESISEGDEWLYPVTQDEVVHEHGTVTLKCTVQENDNSSLQWSNPAQQTLYFDGKKALRDSRIQLVQYSPHELTISISNMTLNDEGIYTCSIFTMPVLTATARVQVLGVPKKPQILGYGGAVEEGTMFTLTCNTTGNKPAATIHWFKGREELTDHVTHHEDTDVRTYTVNSQINITATREDNGVDIICSLDHETLDHNDIQTTQRIEVKYAPSVKIRASKTVPEEGEPFTLRCIGEGNPEPSVFSWMRFNGELSDRAIPRSENLTFNFLNKSDAGVYQCAARNIVGIGVRNYSLTVHESTSSPTDKDPLSELTRSSIDHAVIGGIVAVIVFIALCLLIILIRYLIRHKGTYLTHEAKGSDDAPDADTAIINAEVGHSSSEDKKEYFI
ncbi:cell adhesion molecule 3-like isoform X2 [Hemiscyllium ocellatum]|uniref:cell adhesion molecule 3-like isoform X2 n=1 Tax=Hemiscyllium ocellatum TaxID=170820 RepID=UPI002966F325|nr:cell adhesion molecule 3-like isoform X2 [Hemiscyllium ocellatum]